MSKKVENLDAARLEACVITKKQCLKPWAVALQLPNLEWLIIARYRSRSDADEHFLLLRQRVPNLQFKVVFQQERDRAKHTSRDRYL